MREGDEHMFEKVPFARVRRRDASTSAILSPVGAGRKPLDVAVVGDGDNHVLLANEEFLVVVAQFFLGDLAAALVGVFGLEFAHVGANEVENHLLVAENPFVARDVSLEFEILVRELVGLEAGELLKPHGENGISLHASQARRLLRLGVVQRALKDLRRDFQAHQSRLRFLRIRRRPNDPDDLVNIRQRDQQALDDMGPRPRLAKLKARSTANHVDAMVDEEPEKLLQRERLGTSIHQGKHDHAERVLQRRELEELVENDVGVFPLLDLHDDPNRLFAVGLVLNVDHAGDAIGVHQFRELLEQRLLGLLVRNLGEDDLRAAVFMFLDGILGAEDHAASAGAIGLADAPTPTDRGAGGEVGPWDDLEEFVEVDRGVVEVRENAVANLAEVVRRNARRHADGDAPRTVDQKIRKLARQDSRFLVLFVVIGLEVDGVELDILKHVGGDRAQLRLGVSHRGGGKAVNRAEVPLPRDQQMPHVPPLRHAREGGINRVVAVRVIPLHRLADDTGAL